MRYDLVDQFESERTRLLSVGYRLTGSFADAEDAVQEAWLRLAAADAEEIRDLTAWLTTVVGRICIDRLRSAVKRRETYVGQWLPEPIVTAYDAPDPLDVLVKDEDNRFAALVVLDTMTPDQRVAFVLHDGFGVPFDEIAEMLDVSPASARQHASRARKAAAATPPPVDDEQHAEAVFTLLAAMASGDLPTIVATLHPGAVMIGDANGTTKTAVNVLHGPEKFARFFLGLINIFGLENMQSMVPVKVNGQLGLASWGFDGETKRQTAPARITAYVVRDGLVAASYDIANPEKFRGIKLPDWPTP